MKKTVWLGEPPTNPELPPITIDGAPAGEEIVGSRPDAMSIGRRGAGRQRVNWLTNVGTLFQDDEPTSYIHVAPKDVQSGELACVIRDDQGGVVWRVWSIRVQ